MWLVPALALAACSPAGRQERRESDRRHDIRRRARIGWTHGHRDGAVQPAQRHRCFREVLCQHAPSSGAGQPAGDWIRAGRPHQVLLHRSMARSRRSTGRPSCISTRWTTSRKGMATRGFKKVADDLANFATGGLTGMIATASDTHETGSGSTPAAIVTVIYKAPKDTAAFEKYYSETHLPLVSSEPRMRSASNGPSSPSSPPTWMDPGRPVSPGGALFPVHGGPEEGRRHSRLQEGRPETCPSLPLVDSTL